MSVVDIHIEQPYKKCVQAYGMRQSGKTVLLKYLLVRTPCRYILVDTLHQHDWKPLHSDVQQIVRPSPSEDLPLFLDGIIEEKWREGNWIIVVEELDAYQTVWNMTQGLKKMINWGGNRNVSLWYTVRRLADVHKDIVANCEYHFIFKAYVPNDIEYYRKFVGDVADSAKDLLPYHFIYYRVGGKPEFCKPISVLNF